MLCCIVRDHARFQTRPFAGLLMIVGALSASLLISVPSATEAVTFTLDASVRGPFIDGAGAFHWYRNFTFIGATQGEALHWSDLKTYADATTFTPPGGTPLQGYMATITSVAEGHFVPTNCNIDGLYDATKGWTWTDGPEKAQPLPAVVQIANGTPGADCGGITVIIRLLQNQASSNGTDYVNARGDRDFWSTAGNDFDCINPYNNTGVIEYSSDYPTPTQATSWGRLKSLYR